MQHLLRGRAAEERAVRFLRRAGLQIVARNQNFKHGELDIVARDAGQWVFVEVKFRHRSDYGEPAEMVTPSKQQRLHRAGLAWMQENDPEMARPCRFDVIAISGQQDEPLRWIKDAF
ncbi:MAG: YraN family protein [Cellvibrionales bacterium]|nr:YraN family protein [Cellvibrionales bacterium]